MEIGVALPNFSDLRHREAMVALAQAAEDLDFASIWTSETRPRAGTDVSPVW